MFDKKFNWKIYFFILLFGATVTMGVRVMFLLVTNQVSDEDGLPLPQVIIGLMCFMICLVCSTYLITFISLLKQVILHKNVAFRVDEEGIHDTVVFIYLFAFVLVCKIKFIPWSAVSFVDRDNDGIYIRTNRRQVSASFMGKIIIGILGYHFCHSFTSKKLSQEEMDIISFYCTNHLSYPPSNDIFQSFR